MLYLQCPKCKKEMRTVGESIEENVLLPTILYSDSEPMPTGWHNHDDCCVRMRRLTEKNYNTEKALNDSGARG